jgi:hypothetical protein
MRLAPECRGREEERAELRTVLASEAFARAPSLARFLSYVCEKYFRGEADQLKEYNIATEALGRPVEFDQKSNAIVRVEASRLRRRLQRYYETEGASHEVQITIPPGQYVPVFVHRHGTPPSLRQAREPASTPPPRRYRRIGVLTGVTLAVIVLASTLVIRHWQDQRLPPVAARTAPAGSGELRILAGRSGTEYLDKRGKVWLPDQYYSGGEVFSTPGNPIHRTTDPELFRTRRQGSDFRYDIPLRPGNYELRLLFAETVFGPGNIAGGGETSRLFDVYVNGRQVLRYFDVLNNAGGANTADVVVLKDISPDRDGRLHLRFSGAKDDAILSGIEILPAPPGRMRPVRIRVRDQAYTDRTGKLWEPDCCFSGGQTVVRPVRVSGATDPELYQGERFGNFSYVIPVAAGRYRLTLHFAETWFGPGKPGGGGAGSRLFDVYVNGVALLRNFDIFREAGGADRAIQKAFRGLVPNAQGKITISFVPVVNYACINAIEVEDES